MKLIIVLGGGIALALVLLAVLIDVLPLDPYRQNLRRAFQKPSVQHIFGTDALGRDVFARCILGLRISLLVGITSAMISMFLGTVIGLIAGYFGKITDQFFMTINDALMSIPFIVLIIVLAAALGPGLKNVILILGFTGWTSYARLVRSLVLQIKSTTYIEAAKALGCSDFTIIVRHIFPHVAETVVAVTILTIGQAMLSEATLSFLGLGVPPPIPTLGSILSMAQTYFFTGWWNVVFPGLIISVTIIALNFIGNAINDYLVKKYT